MFPFRNFTVDHVVPRSRGGTDHLDNLQLLCGACNSLKGDRPQEYLVARLAKRCSVVCVKGGDMSDESITLILIVTTTNGIVTEHEYSLPNDPEEASTNGKGGWDSNRTHAFWQTGASF